MSVRGRREVGMVIAFAHHVAGPGGTMMSWISASATPGRMMPKMPRGVLGMRLGTGPASLSRPPSFLGAAFRLRLGMGVNRCFAVRNRVLSDIGVDGPKRSRSPRLRPSRNAADNDDRMLPDDHRQLSSNRPAEETAPNVMRSPSDNDQFFWHGGVLR